MQERDRVRRPVDGRDVRAARGCDERRDAEAAAELDDPRPVEPRGELVRKRETCGPELGPVGHELVLREGVFVEQRLRLVGPDERELELADPDRLRGGSQGRP